MGNNELPRYYTVLFGAVEDALEALDRGNYSAARDLLIRGQLAAEEQYIEAGLQEDAK